MLKSTFYYANSKIASTIKTVKLLELLLAARDLKSPTKRSAKM
jgi:hypothetical protein